MNKTNLINFFFSNLTIILVTLITNFAVFMNYNEKYFYGIDGEKSYVELSPQDRGIEYLLIQW